MSEAAAIIVTALTAAAVALGVGVVLPIVSWLRTSRLDRELRQLRERLGALEEALRTERAFAEAQASRRAASAGAPPLTPQPPPPQPAPATPEPGVSGSQPAQSAAPPPPPLPPDPAASTVRPSGQSLEEAIGGRLMLWVGTIVLVLGVGFFLKYAFDNEWITEGMRVGMGVAGGLALVGTGRVFIRRGYVTYGQIVAGGGIAVLFLSVYAAYAFYELIGRTAAFGALLGVTILAAVFADRHAASGLAVMAVGGGFATPFLVGGDRDAQVILFTYDALLVGGTMFLARRHDWPYLNVLSFAATWLTVAAWADRHYTGAKWLRTELFLTLFGALFVGLLRESVRKRGPWDVVSVILAAGPVIYHVASLAVLAEQGVALLIYLIAVTVVGVGLSVRATSTLWRVVTWAGVVVPLLEWIGAHQAMNWLVPSLVTSMAVFSLHALAQLDLVFRHERRLLGADLVLIHLNGLALIAAAYLALEAVALGWAPAAALAVGVAHGALAWRLRPADRAAALHLLAMALTATAIATTLRLDGPWLTVALAVEGVLVVGLGLRLSQPWFRRGGALLTAVAVARWLLLSAGKPPLVTYRPLLDEAFIVGMVLVALLALVAWRYSRDAGQDATLARNGLTGFSVAAAVLLVAVCSFENGAYWDVQGFDRADARFARSLSLSLVWAVLATAYVIGGLRWRFPPIRYVAIALFGLTVVKVFLVDLSSLGGIYRILGFIGIGLILLAVSYLYQRTRRGAGEFRPATEGSGTEPQSHGE